MLTCTFYLYVMRKRKGVIPMKNLPNDLLIQAYKKAIELQLDVDFQLLLKRELLRRKLNINQVHTPIKDSFGFK